MREALPEVWADPASRLIFVLNDPGVPPGSIADPLAGLPESVAAGVCQLVETKQIGTAQLSANVLSRDVPLRALSPSQQRRAMQEAANNAARSLDRIRKRVRRKVRPVLDSLIRGSVSLREAQEQTAEAWREAYEAVREVGRRASGIERMGGETTMYREEETWFRGAVREELSYWNTFLAEVSRGEVNEDRARERLGHYVQATRFMYESARIQATPDNVLLYWQGPEDERNCNGCIYMLERSPFTKDNIPCVPRDGTTNCLMNCRHRIVVRVPRSRTAIFERRNALPKRSVMLRELKEMRRGSTRTVRASRRARNPFRGTPITAPPPPQPFTYRGRRVRVTRTGFIRESLDEREKVAARPTGDIVDTGRRGKQFEAAFIQALDMLGFAYEENRATGAAWDIRPKGEGWHRLIDSRDVNIKVYSTRWLFSDRAVYLTVRRAVLAHQDGKLSKRQADQRAERAVRKALNLKGLPQAVFMKPKSKAVQEGIIAAVKLRDRKALRKLLVAENFATKRLGRSYKVDVRIDWDAPDREETGSALRAKNDGTWQSSANIAIDGGVGKAFGITGRVEYAGGVLTYFFRDRSSIAAKPPHAARVEAVTEAEDDPHAESCGIFLRVPKPFADKFPSLGSEDDSPAHATLLYVGSLTAEQYLQVVDACREVCAELPALKVEVSDYGEFRNDSGQIIPHMIPRIAGDAPTLEEIHRRLRQAVLARGIPVQHHEGPFKPHITLAYLDPNRKYYTGPRPQDTFWCDALEVWGGDVFGRSPIALGGSRVAEVRRKHAVQLAEAAVLRVKSYEQQDGGWEHVLTHEFVGDDREQAKAFSDAHEQTDRFYGATGPEGEGELEWKGGTIKLRAEPEWIEGPAESLSLAGLGIARADMPQIASRDVPAFLAWLARRGVRHQRSRVRAGRLHPTQSEFDYAKVARLAGADLDRDKPVMVSSDLYVLDGHHRWAAALTDDPDASVSVVIIGLPIRKLLPLVGEFAGATHKGIGERSLREYWGALVDGEDAVYDPGLSTAVKRYGFDDVPAAQQAVKAVRDIKRAKHLPRRVKRALAPDGNSENGREILYDREVVEREGTLAERLPELSKLFRRREVIPAKRVQHTLDRIGGNSMGATGAVARGDWRHAARELAGTASALADAAEAVLHNLGEDDTAGVRKAAKRVSDALIAAARKPQSALARLFGEGLDEAVPSSWDAIPYSSMRLQDVARLLDGATSARKMNVPAVMKIIQRLIGTLEFSAMATIGRPEANRLSNLLRASFGRLGDYIAQGAAA